MYAPVDDVRRRQRQEWRALLLVLLGTVLLVAGLAWRGRADIEQAESERLDGQARAVQRILARQLESTYAALVALREDASSWRGADLAGSASRRLKALADAIPGLAMVALLDPRGQVLASSRLTLIGSDLTARLPARADSDSGTLRVGRPFRDASGAWSIDLTLPVAEADGGGTLIASLDPEYFRLVLRSVLYAPDMRAVLAHGAGEVLMFEPPRPADEGLNVARPGSLFLRHRDSGRDDNIFSGNVQSSGESRLVAMRTLRPAGVPMDVPLVLAINRDGEAVFEAWRQKTLWSGALYGVFALGLAAALALLQQRQRALHLLQQDAQARQRTEAERLALALRGADLGLWDLDIGSGRATVNARWSEMLGYAPGEVSSDAGAWLLLVHPDDRERVDATQQAHIDGRSESYEAVYRMRHRDGRWRWILDRGKVLERNADGAPLRMLGTHMDISERTEAEQALRDRERQLSTMADALPGPVVRADLQDRFLFANAACERWFGWTPAQMVGRSMLEVLGPRVYAVFQTHRPRVLAGENVQYEVATLTPHGRHRWALVMLVPDRDAAGQVCGHFAVIYDITERKLSEDALRSSESKTRALVDNLMVGVIVHAPDTRVLEANPAACALLGLSLAQLRDKAAADPLWHFVDEDGNSLPPPRYPANQVATSGQPLSIIGGILRPGATQPAWVLCNAFPMRGSDGAVTQILVTLLDITERRQAELERRVLERQLRESQRMESIGTLAGGIAHDFNNILAAILGNVALARQDAGPAHPAQASLAQIQQAGLRARSLVQQILAFGRREPGALEIQPLQGIVDETLSLLRATLPASVQLHAQLPALPVLVRADATQLQQVLMNLATNAWHALPGGSGRIEIGIERLVAAPSEAAAAVAGMALPPPPLAHLWVHDDGSGMAAAVRERIFDPFFTTKPVGEGTGLGLSVVHGIVRAHQGCICVDSEPGRGSTFHLYFPSPEAPSAVTPVAVELRGSSAGSTHSGGGRHVLYVDDDEVMALTAERLLQRAGYRVSTSPCAADALQRLRAAPQAFDIVVTDFNMPEMSGIELAQQVALLRPELPVVLSSGLVSEALRDQARQVGVRALLRKEYSFEELAATVERVLADG
jgi:PAS domain S-box-containing protein